jgi:O-antigen/teichoic acid export membrane protein
MKIISYLPSILSSKIDSLIKEERSRKLLINVLSSFLVKLFSMIVTLTLIPVSLKYTDKSTYGVWLTLSSLITWFNLFDMGLSNGLTNKLTESFAKQDTDSARKYLSTTYFFLFLILLPLSIVFFLVSNIINWNAVFNTKQDSSELISAIRITYLSFCFTFILKPINDLLKSKQKHFVLSIIQVSGNLMALLGILFLGNYFSSKFIFLCLMLGFSYPVALFVVSIFFYSSVYKEIYPKISLASKMYFKNIFGISSKFLIIQLSVIVILTSNNFLISYFVDNQSVTYYNIAYRLFSIITIFQIMIMTPLWPAFTDAYTLKDYKWIRSAVSKSNKLNFLLCIPLLLLFLMCNQIYYYWIGPDIEIPFEINLLLLLFVGISIFKETYVSFINGTGKLNLQTSFSIVTILLQFPLAYLFTEYFELGLPGILLLNIFWVSIGLILWRWQYIRIINNKDEDRIWK